MSTSSGSVSSRSVEASATSSTRFLTPGRGTAASSSAETARTKSGTIVSGEAARGTASAVRSMNLSSSSSAGRAPCLIGEAECGRRYTGHTCGCKDGLWGWFHHESRMALADSRAAMTEARLEMLGGASALRDLGEGWDALAPSPFLTRAWLDAWWDAFGSGERVTAVLRGAGGELLAGAALRRTRGGLEATANVH